MGWTPLHTAALGLLACVPALAVAGPKVYLSVEQAQQAMFPGQSLKQVMISLTDEQRAAMKAASGVNHPMRTDRIWRTPNGGWFIVDEVLGKHEMITYAVGLLPDGSVRQVEVLEYRESYGDQIRQEAWRQQFVGKTSAAPLKLGVDIQNISGATLSCKHVVDGVKRVLVMVQLVGKAGHAR